LPQSRNWCAMKITTAARPPARPDENDRPGRLLINSILPFSLQATIGLRWSRAAGEDPSGFAPPALSIVARNAARQPRYMGKPRASGHASATLPFLHPDPTASFPMNARVCEPQPENACAGSSRPSPPFSSLACQPRPCWAVTGINHVRRNRRVPATGADAEPPPVLADEPGATEIVTLDVKTAPRAVSGHGHRGYNRTARLPTEPAHRHDQPVHQRDRHSIRHHVGRRHDVHHRWSGLRDHASGGRRPVVSSTALIRSAATA
jgi:hypothetical protein